MNRGYVYVDRVSPEHAGVTILAYHVRRFAHSTDAEWRTSIEAGRVLCNGRMAAADERVQAGDELEYHRPPWREPEAPTHFRLVHEDQHVLVVDKPAGLQVLPAGPFLERTLFALVRASDPSRAECAPVHRLGRGTSGLILFGKTAAARADLSRQFRERTPCKTYLARVEGCSLPDSVVARHPIGPVAHGPISIHVARLDGKPSKTRVRVLRRDRDRDRSLVAAQPITGRPDQIRVHLAALGSPIVGDPLFGPGGIAKCDATPGAGGYFLHATRLRFQHPHTRRLVRLGSSPPWPA